MTGPALRDWTEEQPGIITHRCDNCHTPFYFQRSFCPACGSSAITLSQSEGRGTVAACTVLHRAPTDELRAYAPYLLALIAMDDGFTVMGHGDQALVIGDRVCADFIAFGDRPTIPFFVLLGDSDD